MEKKKIKVKIIIPIVVIVAIVGMVIFISENKKKEISYNELIEKIGIVEEIEINKGTNTAKVKYKAKYKQESVIIPSIDAFIENVQENYKNIKIKIKE